MKLSLIRNYMALLRSGQPSLPTLRGPQSKLPTVKHVMMRLIYPARWPLTAHVKQLWTQSKGTNYLGLNYPQPPPPIIEQTRNNVLDMFSLKGKVASITGASSGIGYEVAKAYAQAGANLAIWYIDGEVNDKIQHLESTYGIKARAYKVSVTDSDAVERTVQQQVGDFGKIDIFVANAGVVWDGEYSILDEVNNKEWDRIVRVNYDAVYYCAKAVGKHFRERGKGNFIITGSMSGRIINVPDTMAAYCSSKAAVVHLGKALALEWVKFARVNSVSPGYMKTNQTKTKRREGVENWGPLSPMGRMGEPRELVGAYLYLASDASSFTTGTDLLVDGGYTLE